jgi:hypothetical protein
MRLDVLYFLGKLGAIFSGFAGGSKTMGGQIGKLRPRCRIPATDAGTTPMWMVVEQINHKVFIGIRYSGCSDSDCAGGAVRIHVLR